MFKWLFGDKSKNKDIEDLIKVLKSGININVVVSGKIDVEKRGNPLEEREQEFISPKYSKENNTNKEEFPKVGDTIPDLSKFKKPKISFGEEEQ